MEAAESKIRWYVLQAMSGKENKVYSNLEFICSGDAENVIEQDPEKQNKNHSFFRGLVHGIYELNIPKEKIEERKQGKKISKERILYPGYVLIRMQLYDENDRLIPDNWNFIRETKGIIGFCGGQDPVPLTDDEAAVMMRLNNDAEEDKAHPRVQYNVGESVIIKEGAFENCEGVIEAVDDERGRLKVSVSIFGRFTPVEVEFWQVERP